MTQVLDRPTTEVDVRTPTEVRPRPVEVDRELRELPPLGEPPRRNLRWIGWLLGVAVLGLFTWFVISQITTEDTTTTTPTVVVPDGAITADPKARTPVVTLEMVTEAARTGIPGTASLTEITTLGQTPAESLEDATVNPEIYWAVPPTHAKMMEEATVSPVIYNTTTPFDIAEYLGIENFYTVPQVADGAYWRYDLEIAERALLPSTLDLTFGMWPTIYAEPATTTGSALSGALWRFDQAFEEQALLPEMLALSLGVHERTPFFEYTDFGYPASYTTHAAPAVTAQFTEGMSLTHGIWPTMYAEPAALPVNLGTGSYGGHLNKRL